MYFYKKNKGCFDEQTREKKAENTDFFFFFWHQCDITKKRLEKKEAKKETAAEERQRTGCTFAISEKYGESLRLLCMQERQKKKKTHTHIRFISSTFSHNWKEKGKISVGKHTLKWRAEGVCTLAANGTFRHIKKDTAQAWHWRERWTLNLYKAQRKKKMVLLFLMIIMKKVEKKRRRKEKTIIRNKNTDRKLSHLPHKKWPQNKKKKK